MHRCLSVFAVLWVVCSLGLSAGAATPNVVLILADDLGWRDLGVTGSDYYETPNLDRLFASGVEFRNGYASCQVCSPTRASILTGKSPARHGITNYIGAKAGEAWPRNTPLLPPEFGQQLPAAETTLAEALREAGYATFFAGKWHLGGEGSLPTDHGFDVNVGGWESGSPMGGYFSPYKNPQLADGPPGESLPLRLGKETAKFIAASNQKPFFALLSFYSVHGPLETTRERWEENRLTALAKPAPAQRFLFDRRLPVRQTQDHPVYAGMVEAMDDAVGLVVDALEEAGLTEETIVVFTSDNGGVSSGDGFATSNLPLRGGKGRQWEGGLRVPLAIAWPGTITAEQVCSVPAVSVDLYPTVLELCGLAARPEQHVDGASLVPLFAGLPLGDRPLFWHYPHYGNQGGEPSAVVRRGSWKLIRYYEDGREELYHLGDDVGEQNDLAAKRPDRVAELGGRLDEWLKVTGATMPSANPRFNRKSFEVELHVSQNQGMKRLEREAAGVLRSEWAPNVDWWGSNPERGSGL